MKWKENQIKFLNCNRHICFMFFLLKLHMRINNQFFILINTIQLIVVITSIILSSFKNLYFSFLHTYFSIWNGKEHVFSIWNMLGCCSFKKSFENYERNISVKNKKKSLIKRSLYTPPWLLRIVSFFSSIGSTVFLEVSALVGLNLA